jgi:LPXTG-motif cell wall-anchored protein
MSFELALYLTIGLFFFAMLMSTAYCRCGCGEKTKAVVDAERMIGVPHAYIAAFTAMIWPAYLAVLLLVAAALFGRRRKNQ